MDSNDQNSNDDDRLLVVEAIMESIENESDTSVKSTIVNSAAGIGSRMSIDIFSYKRQVIAALQAIDVVGIDSNKHGRSCTYHHTCGRAVKVGDILYTRCELEVDYLSSDGEEVCTDDLNLEQFEELFNNATEKVKVYKVGPDGMAHCHVGYLPKFLFYHFKGAYTFDGLYLRVMVDYRRSQNGHERSRSEKNYGICKTIPIWDDPDFDGKDSFNESNPCVIDRMIESKKQLVQLSLPPPVDRKSKARRRYKSTNNSNRQNTKKSTAPRSKPKKKQNAQSSNSKKRRKSASAARIAAKRVAINTTINDTDSDSNDDEQNKMNVTRNDAKRDAMIRAINDSDSDSNVMSQNKKKYGTNKSIGATTLSSTSFMNIGNNTHNTCMIDLSTLALSTARQSENQAKLTPDQDESPYL